jgi:tight adherence protein B
MLERANLPLRPAEALFFYVAGVAVVALLLFAVMDSPLMALIGLLVVALLPPAIVSFLANRRRKQFNSLLPDTLQLLASTLRAGYSLMQGVEAVSREVSEPMGRELRRVVTEARLGRPLEESLDGVATRMESGDFAWAVMAIRIQREVGGNLAELLVTVAETMTERERLRRDVNALTAEGKVSAIVLGILPVGLGLFIYTANPGYMDPLFDQTIGKILLFGSIILAFIGFWWMKKTIEVDI